MSAQTDWFDEYLPASGRGTCLDVGGGTGHLEPLITRRGFRYINVDMDPTGPGAMKGDAHALPLEDNSVDLVVSKDSLEHFHDPAQAIREMHRVLAPGGRFVIWVPWLHPFHVTDYYRYSPLGLRHLMGEAGLAVESIDAPLGGFSTMVMPVAAVLDGRGLRRAGQRLRTFARWADRRTKKWQGNGAFALAYVVRGAKPAT